MNWSNGFSTTLILGCSPIGRRPGATLARLSPTGNWRVLAGDGRWHRAELRAAWLAGPAAGLRFRLADGGCCDALVLALRQRPADWRRLRVQLKLQPP